MNHLFDELNRLIVMQISWSRNLQQDWLQILESRNMFNKRVIQ